MANDIVVDGGLAEILRRLVGISPTGVLYVAVGTGSGAPAGTETTLQAEAARAIASASQVSGNVATIKAFFNTSQANGNIGEHALFIKSTLGAEDDVMIDRGVEVPIQSKSATQEMIVEKVITLERG